jgi:hypothetical protein
MSEGRQDDMKGSYYANPTVDVPAVSAAALTGYPSYVRPNIWPSDALPELEAAFKALGRLIVDVGLLLAQHCDRHVTGPAAARPARPPAPPGWRPARRHVPPPPMHAPRMHASRPQVVGSRGACGHPQTRRAAPAAALQVRRVRAGTRRGQSARQPGGQPVPQGAAAALLPARAGSGGGGSSRRSRCGRLGRGQRRSRHPRRGCSTAPVKWPQRRGDGCVVRLAPRPRLAHR